MGWNIDRFLAKDTIVSEFICSICTDVVECPVQTPCQHLFCNECIRRWINAGNRTCPEDRQALTVNALRPPSRLTLQFLNKLIIRCKNYNDGCRLMTTFEDVIQLKEHETNQCQVDPNSLVREVCDTYEKEEIVMKEKINELMETISNKEKEIHKLERRIQKQMKEQDKMVKEKEKMSKVIVEFATSHAAIGKSIAEEASKYALYATIPSQPSNDAIAQHENGPVSSSSENQIDFRLISDTSNFVCTASSIYSNFNSSCVPENVLNSTRNSWVVERGAAHNAWIKIEFGCTFRISQVQIQQPQSIFEQMFKAVKIIFSTDNEPYKHTENLALPYKRTAWTGCKIIPPVDADSITINGADYYNQESLPQHRYGICQIQLHGRKIQSQ